MNTNLPIFGRVQNATFYCLQSKLFRYAFLGGVSTLIHISVAFIYVYLLGPSLLISNIFGFLCAFGFSYFAQSKFVFESNLSVQKATKYFVVQFASLLVSILISKHIAAINIYLKIILVSVLLPVITFVAHKFWTFSDQGRPFHFGGWVKPLYKKDSFLLFLIILIYSLLMFIGINNRWVDDESWYLMPIPSILFDGSFRIPEMPGDDVFWPQPPLLTYIQAFVYKISGGGIAAARVIPYLAGVAVIYFTFQFACLLFGSTIALIAATIIAVDNIFFITASTIRPDILVALGVILSLTLVAKGQLCDKAWKYTVLAGIVSGLAVSSHPTGLMAPMLSFIFILFLFPKKLQPNRQLIILTVATIAATLPMVIWIIYNDAPNDFVSFKSHWVGRYGQNATNDVSFAEKFIGIIAAEISSRYADFIQYPYRLHIGIMYLSAIFIALYQKNKAVKILGLMAVSQLLFMVLIVNGNPTVRYFVAVIPVMAVIVAYHIYISFQYFFNSGRTRSAYITSLLLLTLIVGSQFFGNLLYLWKFRNADVIKITQQIEDVIPKNATIFGGMAFWVGLHQNHRYVSYMRMSWQRAQSEYHPEIVIMDDWVMTEGGKSGEFYKLRNNLQDYLSLYGTKILQISNDFYGDLKVYRISYPKS